MAVRLLVRLSLLFSLGIAVAACSAHQSIMGGIGNTNAAATLTPLTIIEGQTGQAVLSLPYPQTTDVVISYSTADGSALAGTNYTSATGTLTIPAGATSASIALTTLDDNVYSNNLTFSLDLSTTTEGVSVTGTNSVTIEDTTPMPTVQFSAATSNGTDSTTPHLINVTLSGESAFPTTVNYAITGGTAVNGTDYTLSPGLITFAPHVTSQNISVAVIDTHLYQPDKTIDLDLSSPSEATLGVQTTHVHTINETASEPSITINNVTVNAGTTASFVVTQSAASAVATTFNYATANGTAVAGTDFTSSSGTATIPAGQTSLTLPVSTMSASLGGEFTLSLSSLTNAVAGTSTTGTGTIVVVPAISIDNVSANAGANVSFVVTLAEASPQNITFNYATANGTATQPTNYTSSSGSATIMAGATSLTLPAITTQLSSGGKSFTESISSIVNAVAGTSTTGTATMIVMPTINVGDTSLPTQIFRSVGPNNTSALATGSSNAMTISGTTATFASALPNNIGVGDAIVYASSGQIAFISGRASSTQYTVETATGTTPVAASADTTWSIYRAYTSLESAIAGNSSVNGNSGIPAALRGFDTFSNNNNLVTGNYQWNIAGYNDGLDNAATAIDTNGWVTSATQYLKIYTPYSATDVGVSQRHNGTWSGGGYELAPASNQYFAINVATNYVTVEGLKIYRSDNVSSAITFDYNDVGVSGAGKLIADANIIFSPNCGGIALNNNYMNTGLYFYFYNNIIVGTNGIGDSGTGDSVGGIYAYNNTLYTSATGLTRWSSPFIA